MGYSTDFFGRFELNKELDDEMFNFLKDFNDSRRMKRNLDGFGIEGEFYVKGTDEFGIGGFGDIIDYNKPPSTQPGLWCQWTPTEDRKGIEWDEGEKFYYYTEWLVYLINKILAPNGYVLNGTIEWEGDDRDDRGKIIVEDNKVFLKQGRIKEEATPENSIKWDLEYSLRYENYMEIGTTLVFGKN
jgi:hypothetical protein